MTDALEFKKFYQTDLVLENSRVKLVPFSQEYEEGLRRIIFDDEISLFSLNCQTEADFKNYMDRTISQRNDNNAYPFIVIDKHNQEVAGSTRFGNINFQNKRLEIGWTWYGKQFRGTGINFACKFELLKFAFENMAFRRVQFSADIDNIRSQKAILKLGAKQEGIFRSNYINVLGESRDDVYYSITFNDWSEIKNTIFMIS